LPAGSTVVHRRVGDLTTDFVRLALRLCFILRLKMLEQRPIETVTGNNETEFALISLALGELMMPEEAKQDYAFLAKNSDQLVIERYAYDFDVTPVPID
jgi:hypothetical protein